MDIELGDKVLKHYPIVFADYPTDESSFIDSTRINNSYTASLGADYDGDTVSIRAVFTQEANAEADRLIKAKTMVLNQSGKNTRKIGNDGALAINKLQDNLYVKVILITSLFCYKINKVI